MIEILTPCRDHTGRGGEQCAHECPSPNDAQWNEFLGGYFHVEQLLTPQERTARAHAQQQREEAAERIRDKTRRYEDLFFGPGMMGFTMPSPEQWVRENLRAEPSEPGTTIPPELNP